MPGMRIVALIPRYEFRGYIMVRADINYIGGPKIADIYDALDLHGIYICAATYRLQTWHTGIRASCCCSSMGHTRTYHEGYFRAYISVRLEYWLAYRYGLVVH